MADLEPLRIAVEAVADKNSAKQAVNDLTMGMEKVLKGGYVAIPAALDVDFKKGGNASKKLRDLRTEFVNQWKDLSSVNFDVPEDKLNEFVKTYEKFNNQMQKESQKTTKQWKALKETGLPEVMQLYTKQSKALQDKITQLDERTTKVKTKNNSKMTSKEIAQKKRDAKKRKAAEDKISDEEIENDIKNENKRQAKRKARLSKEAKEIAQQAAGMKTNTGSGRGNERDARASETSEYAVPSARQARKTEIASKKLAEETGRSYKVGSKEDLEAQKNRKNPIEGRNKNNLPPAEQAKQLSENMTKLLPQILDKIEKSGDEDEIKQLTEELLATAETVSKLSLDAGKKLMTDAVSKISITLGKYIHTTGKIGGTDGTDLIAKSKEPQIESALKGLLTQVEGMETKIIQQLAEIEVLTGESVSDNRHIQKEINSNAKAMVRETIANRQAENRTLGEISKLSKDQKKELENQGRIEKIENVAERVSDTKQEDVAIENKDTGLNTDPKSDELIEAVKAGPEKKEESETNSEDVKEAVEEAVEESVEESSPGVEQATAEIEEPAKEVAQVISSNVNLDKIETLLVSILSALNKMYDKLKTAGAPKVKATTTTEQPKPIDENKIDVIKADKKKQEETKSKPIEAPADWQAYNKMFGAFKALPSPSTIGLPKPDGRRRKISKGLTDDNGPRALTTKEPEMTKALDVLRDQFGKAIDPLKSSLSSLVETPSKMGRPELLDKFYSDRLQRQADAADKKNGPQPIQLRENQIELQVPIDQEHSGLPALLSDVTPLFKNLIPQELADSLREAMKPGLDAIKTINNPNIMGNTYGLSRSGVSQQEGKYGLNEQEAKDLKLLQEEEEARKKLNQILEQEAALAKKANQAKGKNLSANRTVPDLRTGAPTKEMNTTLKALGDKLKSVFTKATASSELDRIKAMSKTQIEDLRAQRIHNFGLTDPTRNATDTGDRIRAERNKDIYNHRGRGLDPFKDIKALNGMNFDVDGITDALQNAIQKNMFSAQTGFNGPLDLIKLSLGGIGMPSLEKSRAEADGLNEIMAQIRQTVADLLNKINSKKTDLEGMERNGDATFDANGNLVSGTSEAKTTNAEMLDLQYALAGVLADMQQVDVASEKWSGDIHKILQNIGFISPELQKCNTIIGNLNAGLNKNGKALKFQKRIQETMNYTFQLMTRSVGQMIKNWISMLNPINLIKKAFSDFTSYDVKWQRTMNVIKYNIRRIIRPAMEWIAQQIVNIIGLVNALIKGIGSAFGKNWDLFDKDAAEAEKIREEMEAAANVTLGFDELHDIGTDNSGANDLTGDIYTPQWDGLYEGIQKIGEVVGKMLKGLSSLSFWEWLAIAGGALLGLMALKWLIGIFSGKNPLQSVADGVKSLLKSVGNALVIASLALFVKCLGDFVEVMKSASWEDIVKSLLMLAGGLATLVLAIGGIAMIITGTGIGAGAMALVALIIAAIALLVFALSDFIKTVSEHKDAFELIIAAIVTIMQTFNDFVINILTTLGDFIVNLVSTILQGVADIIQTVGDVIIGIVDAICTGISDLITAVGEAIKSICEGIATIVQSVLEGIASVIESVGEAIKSVLEGLGTAFEGFATVVEAVGTSIKNILEGIATAISTFLEGVANAIKTVVEGIANAIKTVLEPILGFIDSVIGKVLELASTIAHEIGETIRTIIETVGNVIITIIDKLLNAIPNLLNAILRFCREIGPAIENSVDAILRSVTKLINFMISGIEYLVNTLLIGSLNKVIEKVTMGMWKNALGGGISIPRFVPQYEKGTNYVPNDGLAYLHQGEAVVPKKYNHPVQSGMSAEERTYMERMIATMNTLDTTMKQGINVKGEFRQRGSDLVATVERNKNRLSNNVLNNSVYAR